MKFCVIGLGRFGYSVAETLAIHGMEVLAIDSNETIIASIRDKVTQAICMHVSDEESLIAVGIDEFSTVIVGMGKSFAQSILITALLKKHIKIPNVISRATNIIHEDILKIIGADKVVSPQRERGSRLAHNLSFPFIDIVSVSNKFSITTIKAPTPFVGKSIQELDLRKKYQIACIGVKKGEKIELINYNYVILEEDHLLIAGENKILESVSRL